MAENSSALNVAIIGRPNVGKSTFVNRVIGKRTAIVFDTPGVTRDRVAYPSSWNGVDFNLIDTGGWQSKSKGLDLNVTQQAEMAFQSADVIVLMVDARIGIAADDEILAKLILRSKIPAILAVNKVDNADAELDVPQFYKLGMGEPFAISALQGRDIGDFLDLILNKSKKSNYRHPETNFPKIALVGKPNVGKSSLFNLFAHDERAVVNATPGTTRDAIDSDVEIEGNVYSFIDTAGLNPHKGRLQNTDFYSDIRTQDALMRCDLALLLLDATQPISDHDLRIINSITDGGKAICILMNKYDLLDDYQKEILTKDIANRLAIFAWIPVIKVSALTKWHTNRIIGAILESLGAWNFRIPTHELNSFILGITAKTPHPVRGGKQPKIQYASQVDIRPPKILLHTSGRLDHQYVRFIENELRDHYPFAGTPINIIEKPKPPRKND